MDSETNLIVLIGAFIFSFIGVAISAWIFSFFFDTRKKISEMEKQTELLRRIEEKLSK
ncbi:MAG: hypothetical protein IPG85_11900 [Bacteroidetes bacterium]|nr:hypothetical protein [Bacteroidota bacterium]